MSDPTRIKHTQSVALSKKYAKYNSAQDLRNNNTLFRYKLNEFYC